MSQLIGLHAKFTGDASGLAAATKQATGLLDQYGRSLKKVGTAQTTVKTSTDTTASAFHKLKMETDNVYAGLNRYARAAEIVAKQAVTQSWSTAQLDAELLRLADHYGVAQQAGLRMNDAMRSSRFHTANLAAQFNDIGVMMASGQSPFILAIQQGTQITQVMQSMGGTAKEQMGALAAAFRSIISPTALVTIALIAGTAALYQWATSSKDAKDETKSFEDELNSLTSVSGEFEHIISTLNTPLGELIDKFGLGAINIRAMTAEMIELEKLKAFDKIADSQGKIVEQFSALNSKVTDYGTALQYVAELEAKKPTDVLGLEQLKSAKFTVDNTYLSLEKLAEEFGLTAVQALEVVQILREMEKAKGPAAQAQAASDLARYLSSVTDEAGRIPAPLRTAAENAYQLSIETLKLANLFKVAEDAAKKLAVSGPASSWMDSAIKGVNTLLEKLQKGVTLAGLLNMAANNLDAAGNRTQFPAGSGARTAPPAPPAGTGGIDWGLSNQGSGSGSKTDQLATDLQQLQDSLKTKTELEMESYTTRQQLLEDALQKRYITQTEHDQLMLDLQKQHSDAMTSIDAYRYGSGLDKAGQFFGDMADALASGNDKMLKISKAFGAAEALINAWRAYAQVIAQPNMPFLAKFAAAAKVLAAGMSAVNAIKGISSGGGGSRTASTSSAASTPQQPLQATLNLQGPFASALSGALGPLLDGLTKEAGDRGYQLMVRTAG